MAAATKSTLLAVDTNFLLDLAADSHLLDVPAGPLKLLLDAHDVASPIIVSPRKIAREFFPK
jgi:hypothetical protein